MSTDIPRPSIEAVKKYTFKAFGVKNKVYCEFCNRVLTNNKSEMEKHFFSCTILSPKPTLETEFKCGPCSETTTSFKHWMNFHISTKAHWNNCKLSGETLYTYTCSSCDLVLYDTEEVIQDHMFEQHDHKANLPYICEYMSYVKSLNNVEPLYFCGPCKKYSDAPIHQDLACTKIKKKSEPFYCKTCNANFICNEEAYLWHLSSVEHLSQVEVIEEISNNGWKLPRIIWTQFLPDTNQQVKCGTCTKNVPSNDTSLLNHFKNCKRKPNMSGKDSTVIEAFVCAVCDSYTSDFNEWKNHVLSETHLTNSYNFRNYTYQYCEMCDFLLYGTTKQILDKSKRLVTHIINPQHSLEKFKLAELMGFVYKTFNVDPRNSIVFFYCETTGKFGLSERNTRPKSVPFFCETCHIEFYSGLDAYREHEVTLEHILIKYFVPLKSTPINTNVQSVSKDNDDENYGRTVTARLKAIKNEVAKKNIKMAIDTLFSLEL